MPDQIDERIEGVYFEEKVLTGGLREKIRYWAREDADGSIVLEYLKLKGGSTGLEAERITREAFAKRFTKEPVEEQEPQKSTEERQKDKTVREGQLHLERKEFHSAEFEFKKVLKVDETHLEANVGLGESFVGQGRVEEAKEVFSRVTEIDRIFEKKNKHMFNRLGINLRKQGMYTEAVKYYEKAIELDSEDPVLYFNLGRAHYHLNKLDKTVDLLKRALGIEPNFEEATEFLAFIRKGRS